MVTRNGIVIRTLFFLLLTARTYNTKITLQVAQPRELSSKVMYRFFQERSHKNRHFFCFGEWFSVDWLWMPQNDLDKSFFAQKSQLMSGLLLYDKPGCREKKSRWLPESTLRAPFGDSRHKLPEETVRNKTPQEVQVQWTWIWWWWFHFTKCFRWRLQLTGYKVPFICWRGDKLDNQSELLHHVQDILLNQALLLATLGEHMINQLHVEGACFLHFFPQTGMSRFLTKPREGFSVNITRTSNL